MQWTAVCVCVCEREREREEREREREREREMVKVKEGCLLLGNQGRGVKPTCCLCSQLALLYSSGGGDGICLGGTGGGGLHDTATATTRGTLPLANLLEREREGRERDYPPLTALYSIKSFTIIETDSERTEDHNIM